MDRQQAALFREQYELRDELFGILLWAVYVVAPRGDHRELVRGVVRLDQHLSPRLGGRVGVGGLQRMALMVTNLHTHRGLAVHLRVCNRFNSSIGLILLKCARIETIHLPTIQPAMSLQNIPFVSCVSLLFVHT